MLGESEACLHPWQMMNAGNAWRWPELQKEASMPSHASSTTPTAPSAQVRMPVPNNTTQSMLAVTHRPLRPGAHSCHYTQSALPGAHPHRLAGACAEHERPRIPTPTRETEDAVLWIAGTRVPSMNQTGWTVFSALLVARLVLLEYATNVWVRGCVMWVCSRQVASHIVYVWLQMLQELMHQMQASTQGFAARFPNGSFPIPSLDAGQPNIGQWRQ